ncbi:MAG TPA: ABC transporter permease [Micromonosporaceae bacterium]|jgi:lipooligosaccharide transport system permease protein|nr:ABC transporter permease [Micromonosporaceae bacterium]
MAHPALAVLEFDLVGYRRTWRGSVLSSFVLPVLFVLGFGLGVGSYVDASGRLGDVSYLDYIAPGMIASTALQIAFGESSWSIMSRFIWIRTYHAMAASPLRVVDIIGGDLLYILLRVVSASAVFTAVVAAFGAVHSPWVVTLPVVAGWLGLASAAPVLAYAARVETDSFFPLLFRFVMVPMTLFAGVFFPVSSMPAGLRILAYISPLWHGVEVCRAAAFGTGSPAAIAGHLAYLGLWVVVGFWLAQLAYRRRLAV